MRSAGRRLATAAFTVRTATSDARRFKMIGPTLQTDPLPSPRVSMCGSALHRGRKLMDTTRRRHCRRGLDPIYWFAAPQQLVETMVVAAWRSGYGPRAEGFAHPIACARSSAAQPAQPSSPGLGTPLGWDPVRRPEVINRRGVNSRTTGRSATSAAPRPHASGPRGAGALAGLACQAFKDAGDTGRLQRARVGVDELARDGGCAHADTTVSHASWSAAQPLVRRRWLAAPPAPRGASAAWRSVRGGPAGSRWPARAAPPARRWPSRMSRARRGAWPDGELPHAARTPRRAAPTRGETGAQIAQQLREHLAHRLRLPRELGEVVAIVDRALAKAFARLRNRRAGRPDERHRDGPTCTTKSSRAHRDGTEYHAPVESHQPARARGRERGRRRLKGLRQRAPDARLLGEARRDRGCRRVTRVEPREQRGIDCVERRLGGIGTSA